MYAQYLWQSFNKELTAGSKRKKKIEWVLKERQLVQALQEDEH